MKIQTQKIVEDRSGPVMGEGVTRRAMVLGVLIGAVSFIAATPHAFAAYPDRAIRLIVPFPPGGTSDLVARLIATPLSVRFKQPIIIENRAGANGIIGTEALSKAAPDGYTFALLPSGHAINGSLKNLNYDTEKSFTPLMLIGTVPLLGVVNPASSAMTLQKFLELARNSPKPLSFKSAGVGGSDHLATELLMRSTGIKMLNVPYKGDPPAATDLVGGQIDFGLFNITSVLQLVNAGKLRALGVSAEKRSALLPDLPTFEEAGVKGYTAGSWHAFFAPAGLPPDVLLLLNSEMNAILKTPDVARQLSELGFSTEGGSSEKLGKFLRVEVAKWDRIIREAGIPTEKN
jgi:tripartite-type tricarboxylate transporter receptor subunit TctC